MADLFHSYPYLFTNLVNLGCLLLLIPFVPRAVRRMVLFSSLLALPGAFQEGFDVPGYWRPVRTVVFLGTSPETFLCASTLAGWAALAAFWPTARRWPNSASGRGWWRRYLAIAVVGVAGRPCLQMSGAGTGAAMVGSVLLGGIAVLCCRPRNWPLAAWGAMAFAPLYFLIVKLDFTLAPHYAQQWNSANAWGVVIRGVPLEEVAWGMAMGATWPAFAAYVLNVQWLSKEAEAPAPESAGRQLPMPLSDE